MINRPEIVEDTRPFYCDEPVTWEVSSQPVAYPDAVSRMEDEAAAIAAGKAPERIWLLEHPAIYTAGTSAKPSDLLTPMRFPVFTTGRGGQYTYHGPGQRIVYVMLDLKRRRRDVRLFVQALEQWMIDTLGEFNITGERRQGRIGIWVRRPEKAAGCEEKIGAIGIRLRHWVSFHGLSINVEPDLEHFSGIVPCGIAEHGVTSMVDLGLPVTMVELDERLKHSFSRRFGPVVMSY